MSSYNYELFMKCITSGFIDVFAKQKFGWSLQGGISKSFLYVFSARKKAEGSVKFSLILIRPKGVNMSEGRGGVQIFCFFFLKRRVLC